MVSNKLSGYIFIGLCIHKVIQFSLTNFYYHVIEKYTNCKTILSNSMHNLSPELNPHGIYESNLNIAFILQQ
jgi:hypothetical protein